MKTLIFDFDGTLCNTKSLVPFFSLLKDSKMSKEKYKVWKNILSHVKDCNLYEGISELFEYIDKNNIKSSILSDSSLKKIRPCCDFFNIPIPKELQVGGYTLNRYGNIKKPNPILIDYMIDLMQSEKSNTLMIGNSSTDIQTAINADIKSVACMWDADDKDKMIDLNPTYIIEHPLELIPIIQDMK